MTITVPDKSRNVRIVSSAQEGVALTVGTEQVEFSSVKHLLSDKPLRRPNRTKPLYDEDKELQNELDAWEAASDEALEQCEDSLSE